MVEINLAEIEKKWQARWEAEKVFEVSRDSGKDSFYVLEMFPYPSGEGLHMGHALNYTIGDILARFKKMKGFNVLHPMGFDSLGLPAENAAIKAGTHPEGYTNKAIENFIRQQKRLGVSYDWSRMVNSADPGYYKWDQWIFLKMLEKGLAYQKEASVNWCPKCNTVLANEQVNDGRCWRHEDTDAEVRKLRQWFFRTREYAEELLDDLENLDWPEKTKLMQRNWIGRSEGAEISFEVEGGNNGTRMDADGAGRIGNVVIVHGCDSSKDAAESEKWGPEYLRHWKPWIKEQLEKGDINVSNAVYPKNWEPNYENWKNVFEKNNINENSVLIGHSCGCAFLVRWLGETGRKVKKLILVAPWKIADKEKHGSDDVFDIRKRFYDYDINPVINKNVGEIIFFTSNNEADAGKKSLQIYQKVLDGRVINLKNHGHYTKGNMGTDKFPELLEEVLKPRIDGNARESGKVWKVFTTRPDTIFGVTFMVVAAGHDRLDELVTEEQRVEVDGYLKKMHSVSEKDIETREKEGVFSGSYAINPATGEKVPIWIGNFVLTDYGSGMVMGVPAHDQRDFEFAKKYGIEVRQVVANKDPLDFKNRYTGDAAFVDYGILMDSKQFNGMSSLDAKVGITEWLASRAIAKNVVNYKLRDWGISRQRYWGTPIPIIYCGKCGAVPVPENELPVVLPHDVKFGKGNPLETNKDWLNCKCPKCGGNGRRESDTMDTFVNSSWYFLRYCDPNNSEKIFDFEKVKSWNPVDVYIGGAEHACMHLLYSRFYVKFLRDIGALDFDEPFTKLFHQGLLHAEDGRKMSKSFGNVVEPIVTVEKYGVDATRWFLVSVASPDKDFDWSENGILGATRFLKKIFEFYGEFSEDRDSSEVVSKLNLLIKNIGEYYNTFEYRKATIELREFFSLMVKGCSKNTAIDFLKLISPICPHVSEELFEKLGGTGFVSKKSWPEFDESKILKGDGEGDLNGRIVSRIREIVRPDTKKVYVYVMPFEIEKIDAGKIGKEVGMKVEVFAVNDSSKVDPKGLAKRAKPGMASVYLE